MTRCWEHTRTVLLDSVVYTHSVTVISQSASSDYHSIRVHLLFNLIAVLSKPCLAVSTFILRCDLVPKGVHENRTKGIENKVDDTLKLVVFLECAQC